MYFCKECGAIVDDDDKFCRKCGAKLSKDYVCPYCGSPCEVTEDGIKCTNCQYTQTMDGAIEEFVDALKDLDENTLDEINKLLDEKLTEIDDDKHEIN